MKDLYSGFGLSPASNLDAIRKGIEARTSAVDVLAARQILLNPNRKRVYDRAHQTATQIGKLEVELGLPIDGPTRAFRPASPTMGSELEVFEKSKGPTRRQTGRALKLLAVAIVGSVILFYSTRPAHNSAPAYPTSDQRPSQTLPKDTTTPPVKSPAFPPNGFYKTSTNKALGAPFRIVTQAGDTNSYYCKLINAKTGLAEMELFVTGGHSADFQVPLGTYRLKYASGSSWHGANDLFGESTVCKQIKTPFEFKMEGKKPIGRTAELDKRGGILRAEVIPRSDF